MKRKKAPRGDAKYFKLTASRTRRFNVAPVIHRGGIRL
nr:hypothetical protein KCFLNJMA_KCFLNJMA_CDS_0005 [Microvirus sp.]